MIRKAIIVVLTLGALVSTVGAVLLYPPILRQCSPNADAWVWKHIHSPLAWSNNVLFVDLTTSGRMSYEVPVIQVEYKGSEVPPGATLRPNRRWSVLGLCMGRSWGFHVGGDRFQIWFVEIALFTVAFLLAVYPSLAFIRGPVRRYRRRRRGLCARCGYNLTGNVSGVCPECGAKAQSKRPDAADTDQG